MGWRVYLNDGENAVEIPNFNAGSNLVLNGERTEANLTITYNYGPLYHFREELHNKTGEASIPSLQEIVDKWGHLKPEDNYWLCTPGNVAHICKLLLSWAQAHPTAVWEIA